jgi:hypothetical protein
MYQLKAIIKSRNREVAISLIRLNQNCIDEGVIDLTVRITLKMKPRGRK